MRALCVALAVLTCSAAGCARNEPAPDPPRRLAVPAEDVTALAAGNRRFALDLYGRLAKEPGNVFVSPYSLSTALGMTYAGARGETAAEMAETLHFALEPGRLHPASAALREQTRPGKGYELTAANRLWVADRYPLLPEFLAVTRQDYGAAAEAVDFKDAETARGRINEWAAKETHGKVTGLVPAGALDPMTGLVLTSAIYFKGKWHVEFDKKLTHDRAFFLDDKKHVTCPFMLVADDFPYFQGDNYHALVLPYAGKDVSLLVLLPHTATGLAGLEKKLGTDLVDECLKGLNETRVTVRFPRLKLSRRLALKETLSAMGMPTAFDQGRADFSGMTGDKLLFISGVFHEAFVEMNEEGTEAGAATAVVMTKKSDDGPRERVFDANRPFVFLILDRRTNSILFIGRVANPKQ